MRELSILPNAAIGAAVLLSTFSTPVAGDMTFDETIAAFRNGNYELAVRGLESLIEESPLWAEGYVLLGQCYYMTGVPGLGDRNIRNAFEIDGSIDRFAVYFNVGKILSGMQRYDDAVPPLERALAYAADSRKSTASFDLAHSYLLAGRYEDARGAFESHEKEFGGSLRSSLDLALACQRLGEYPHALDSLRKASGYQGDDSLIRKVSKYRAEWSRYWALLPENGGRREALIEDAAEDARPWFELEPADPTASSYYAELLLASGRGEQLVRDFTAVANSDDSNCAVRIELARASNALGRGRDAERWAIDALRCDSAEVDAHVEAAAAIIRQLPAEYAGIEEVRRARERVGEAIASLDRARELDPDHRRAAALLAGAAETDGRLDELEAEFRRLADEDELERIRDRCRVIVWKIRSEVEPLTAEDRAFHEAHDCSRFDISPRDE